MDIAEWMTRQAVSVGASAALDMDGRSVSTPIPVTGWMFEGGRATATVVFGPYAQKVTASGVRLIVDGAESVEPFSSPMTMPAGQTYRATVSIGVG